MYKQIIIARKDLNMSSGKLAAQVSHASMAFLTTMIKEHAAGPYAARYVEENDHYTIMPFDIDKGVYEGWIAGSFTKVVLEAKNKLQLLKAVDKAEMMGLREGKDYFLIKDSCCTELMPEEVDGSGIGRTLTCIGFVPMDEAKANEIGKMYQLWKH